MAVTAPGLLQLQSSSTHPNRRLGVPGGPRTALIVLVPPASGPCPSAVPALYDNSAQERAGVAHAAGAGR